MKELEQAVDEHKEEIEGMLQRMKAAHKRESSLEEQANRKHTHTA